MPGTKHITDLIVVVNPDYADRLETAAEIAPVWIVATETNRYACERQRKNQSYSDHRETGAVTCYKTSNPEDRLGSLLGTLPQVETHHGEVKEDKLAFPDDFVLEVIGLALADEVAYALREFGFTHFVEAPEGFQACTKD